MLDQFDQIAKRLWFADGETVRLIKNLRWEIGKASSKLLLSIF